MNSPNSDIKPKKKVTAWMIVVIIIVAVVGGVVLYHLTTEKPKKKVETIDIAAPVYSSSSSDWTNFINNATSAWQAAHPNVKINFVGPFGASTEGEYYTKLDLMTSSPSTAPTVMLEDMFYTATYKNEGILAPLNSYVNSSVFSNLQPSALGQMTINGVHYGLPAQVTDTLIYYNITLLQKAGVISSSSTTWNPTNWTQIINAAEKINSTLVPTDPGLVPMNIYEGVKAGEAASFTGFEGLLYGTGYGLYNFTTNKWCADNPGLNETFQFYKTVFDKGLATPSLSAIPYITVGEYMQEGKLGIAIDGSWMYGYQWAPGAQHTINNFSKYIGVAAIPTYNGTSYNTMVGGWGWAMYNGTPSSEKPTVVSFMEALDNTSNQILINEPGQALAGGLPTSINAVKDPSFAKLMPEEPQLDTFYSSILKYGSYRPPVAEYPAVSDLLQEAMGNIVSAHDSVSKTISIYDTGLESAVGSSNVQPSFAGNILFPITGHSSNYTSGIYNYLLELYSDTSLLASYNLLL
jgi:multiple sugar transport system substrate-binding protein